MTENKDAWLPDSELTRLRRMFLSFARIRRGTAYFASTLKIATEYGREARRRKAA